MESGREVPLTILQKMHAAAEDIFAVFWLCVLVVCFELERKRE